MMADDAFALSPISARASLPSEADYGAIREAFMETARGRWFLDEYARRNRNADTGLVLEAVARLEAGIAAQTPAAPSPEQVLAAIRPLIAQAGVAADAAMASHDAEDLVAAGRRGARIIREISWSLRETGTDPRICNILDQQLLAFDALHDHVHADARRELIGEVFADLALRIEDTPNEMTAAPMATATSVATPTEPVERVGANIPLAHVDAVPTPASEPAHVEPQITPSPVAAATDTLDFAPSDDEVAADDAMLGLIAIEMSAPDIADTDAFDGGAFDRGALDGGDAAISELHSLAATPVVTLPAAPATPPQAEPSLGDALIASGVVHQPRRSGDALAPFRRMSQIEKIAFFS